ncbi:MAG: dTDP-4-dehydrorhamnose 3,5-epimerase [Ilumatobacteraceae bacterium]|nr:dTDP-4-dehydrorhamnose 3,5-epimerase [Acidimicrobiales bacterium]MCB9392313.1 dTDP-4-dehydrorhamnose 3,5-epimerase [Acidimicrobiaceae bacterium]
MKFVDTHLAGAWILDLDRRDDDRGFFARAFCRRELEDHGVSFDVKQANLSFNSDQGTVRGMHFQYPPAGESKLIRCISGAIVDVIVDVRPESATFLSHLAVELTASNRRALVIPPRFAHGYMTLTADAEVMYLVDEFYTPSEEGGLRWDDPALAIDWPAPMRSISPKDAAWPDLGEQLDHLRARMALGTSDSQEHT